MSGTKTIYLHIGVPKTASKTIQEGLTNNREILEKLGYLYPNSGWRPSSHRNIFYEISKIPGQHSQFLPKFGNFEELLQEISSTNCKNIIISCESFAVFESDEILTLYTGLKKYETKIIVYLRRQDQIIQSGWIQNAKRFVTKVSLDQNILDETSSYNTCFHYDYLLEIWAHQFGKENIIAKIFESSKLRGNIFNNFLQSCGIHDTSKFDLPESQNISPSNKTLGLILAISNLLDFDRIDDHTRMRIGEEIELICSEKGWNEGEKFNQISFEMFRKIMDHFDPGNRKVAKNFFNSETLFSESSPDTGITKFSLDQISNTDLLEIFIHLLNTFSITWKPVFNSKP